MTQSQSHKKNPANIPLDADRLRQARHACQYSIEEAASLASLNKMTLLRYESGDIRTISPDRLSRLAVIYQTTPSYLCGVDPQTEYMTEDGILITPSSAEHANHLGKRLQAYLNLVAKKI